MHLAAVNGYYQVVVVLLIARANPEAETWRTMKTAREWAKARMGEFNGGLDLSDLFRDLNLAEVVFGMWENFKS